MKIKLFLVSSLIFLTALPTKAATALYNPLGDSTNSLPILIGNAIRGVLGLVGAVALVMIVIGGVTWMTSAGNADRVRRGKDTLLWAILGIIIIFVSYSIVNFVFSALLNGAA